mgnify:CR=1 FL=1
MAQELPRDRAVERRERELAMLATISTRLHGEEDVQAILDSTLETLDQTPIAGLPRLQKVDQFPERDQQALPRTLDAFLGKV